MNQDLKKVLLLGYGNPIRQDDGLGPALAQAMEKLHIDGVTVDVDYQLTVEDAAAIADHDVVVFADAALEGPEPFSFTRLAPAATESFSTHSIRPAGVLGLAKDMFNAGTEAFMLGIRGYDFDMFKENLTEKAAANLQQAIQFLEPLLRQRSFPQVET